MESFGFRISEIDADRIVYAQSRSFANLFHNIFDVVRERFGEERATEVAQSLGRRYGVNNYGGFLRSRGVKEGSPALMCEFQDMAHAIRGPDHASALFGEFDEERCMVKRTKCIYFSDHPAGMGQYTAIFEAAVAEGYQEVDPALERVDNPRCLCKGDSSCEVSLWFSNGSSAARKAASPASAKTADSQATDRR
jgi:hypothetical protein